MGQDGSGGMEIFMSRAAVGRQWSKTLVDFKTGPIDGVTLEI